MPTFNVFRFHQQIQTLYFVFYLFLDFSFWIQGYGTVKQFIVRNGLARN